MDPKTVTRFAPSPTGALHLGNARTALFSYLLGRASGGRFILRVEDSDRERSGPEFVASQLADLGWLGLSWDAGPDRDDGRGPYRQSARSAIYEGLYERLERDGHAYPCYCTPLELDVARRAQVAAGQPPRYPGTCRELDAATRAARVAEGRQPALRFRVPVSEVIEFEDLVRGPQSVVTATLGDFVLRRADGGAMFF
ncbi:MAG: glutamate--tRNA ligase family protein, partial [Gammaproteobacteria bacterium]|nr:glutamate--tRNA ligase family protein [Gammaproteobacteria bacterium]